MSFIKNKYLFTFIIPILLIFIGCNKGLTDHYKIVDNDILFTSKTSVGIQKTRLSFISEDVVRITSTVNDKFSIEKSLITVDSPGTFSQFKVVENDSIIEVSTPKLLILYDKNNGHLQFLDEDKKPLLKETVANARQFEKAIDSSDLYKIRQIFESPEDEAFYGLGHHQHGYVNYKNKDVELAQHNIVAVVPFLYSSKNYGILWDNYSITKFGDPRNYENINSLQLKDKYGKLGGLTMTSFKNNKQVAESVANTIDFEYLETPSYLKLPPTSEVDKIVYEGSFTSLNPGTQKFLLYASSYFKVWIDGEMILDKWRQNWNPWSNPFEVKSLKDQSHKLKIEWVPNAGYLSLKTLGGQSSEEKNHLSIQSDVAKEIDYYFIKGNNADEVINGYRILTGKASMLPKWAFGFWQSRERYKTQDEILETMHQFRSRHIPIDNIVLDWSYWPENAWGSHEFDLSRFPDAEKMNATLHDSLKAHILISVWPKFYEGIEHYNEMNEKGFLFTNNIKKNRVDWIAKGYKNTFYNPFIPEARKLFWKQINEHLYSKKFDGWWLDATEPDMHSNLSISDRIENMSPTGMGPGAQFFNAYSLLNAKGIFEGQRETNPDKRVLILTRSAFAGQQKFGAITWSGDIVSRWSDLKDQIAAGINFGLSGMPFWTTDIGGFAVEDRYANNNKNKGETLEEWRELNTRWYQFGAFCPIFRAHGQYPYREIYNISPENHEAYQSMLYYDKLRYSLLPYIYSLVGEVYQENSTIMRGLVMDFPNDTTVLNIADQYLFGKDFLICPISQFKQRNKKVYLPIGNDWYDMYNGKKWSGGQWINADAPYERIPIFIKSGAIIPVGGQIESTADASNDTLKFFVYDGNDGEFTLYDDAGDDFTYEANNFATTKITFDNTKKTLTFDDRKGAYYNKGKVQTFKIVLIDQNNKSTLNDTKLNKEVIYNGDAMTIKF